MNSNFINCVLDFDSKLYIGDAYAFHYHKHYNINAIISFCTEQQFQTMGDVEQMVLTINDRPQCDISQCFDQTNQFIQKNMDLNKNVLVHCVAGKSRSATIILAYLMYSQQWTLQEALIYLKSIRQLICPNPGFIRQLLKYEEKLFGQVRSNLTYDLTPYYSVQKADTVIPEGPRINQRRASFSQLPMYRYY